MLTERGEKMLEERLQKQKKKVSERYREDFYRQRCFYESEDVVYVFGCPL